MSVIWRCVIGTVIGLAIAETLIFAVPVTSILVAAVLGFGCGFTCSTIAVSLGGGFS